MNLFAPILAFLLATVVSSSMAPNFKVSVNGAHSYELSKLLTPMLFKSNPEKEITINQRTQIADDWFVQFMHVIKDDHDPDYVITRMGFVIYRNGNLTHEGHYHAHYDYQGNLFKGEFNLEPIIIYTPA